MIAPPRASYGLGRQLPEADPWAVHDGFEKFDAVLSRHLVIGHHAIKFGADKSIHAFACARREFDAEPIVFKIQKSGSYIDEIGFVIDVQDPD